MGVFTAYLVHTAPGSEDRAVELPLVTPMPPSRVRLPDREDPARVLVYELVTAEDWPREATYRFRGAEDR
ncbi:hypothetical protein [Leifsonia sp. C5G2]|uniref:hypothetical protein n=1 Tax=Leifsonia sp. C5G2 TaxID=2735269 RepID=UPI00201C63A9|nr:hypothetical protein [Leifsonia sp. C5G2]